MRLNEHTAVVGPSVVLVPYRQEHVKTYHEWMSRPEILELTASEPLTLEKEYDMQRKWREDDDKLTFIILARDIDASEPVSAGDITKLPMVGDVNVFLTQPDEAELEIMIAGMLSLVFRLLHELNCEEDAYRRRGLARCALQLLLTYITAPPLSIAVSNLVAKIGKDNAPSIALFRSLGFELATEPNVFNEVSLRYTATEPESNWVRGTQLFYADA
ncbi:hypothetical protein EXIGLDRAFT_711011 [Exidia glandulosa HHB12029]|uniref:N-acetyltransferase domain-containing protein n=1 Tax=Exidia glandulosa HHB12029 TaxID=1314781 RepID=A0A166BFY4_EXIGL|nr:hypothetical protein EXIGLDRAFT_711011 [Exidia glandulosa HHB12029]